MSETQTAPLEQLRDWIGREETVDDVVRRDAVRGLYATLDRPDCLREPLRVPQLVHWLHFHPVALQSDIGADGHPKRGGFLPPVPLPRRMWAGSRLRFTRTPAIGERIVRRSLIKDVRITEGRSGALVFVTVEHQISGDAGAELTDEHDIVYRDAPAAGAKPPAARAAPTGAVWRRQVTPDPVMLFRYSALTFNGHRIHYDQPYVTQVEGYPGLIVHGPLIATLLLDLFDREQPQARVAEFSFRAVSPLFDIAPFFVCGAPADNQSAQLWAENASGALAMEASVKIAR
jgi:3-methylfumaryl-CoA hydratase